jgi:hypothetical protein
MRHRSTGFSVTWFMLFAFAAAGPIQQVPCADIAAGFSSFTNGVSYLITSCPSVGPITISGSWIGGSLEVVNSTFPAGDAGIFVSTNAVLTGVTITVTASTFHVIAVSAVGFTGATLHNSIVTMNACTVAGHGGPGTAVMLNNTKIDGSRLTVTGARFVIAGASATLGALAVVDSVVSGGSQVGIDGGTVFMVSDDRTAAAVGTTMSVMGFLRSNVTSSAVWIRNVQASVSAGAAAALALTFDRAILNDAAVDVENTTATTTARDECGAVWLRSTVMSSAQMNLRGLRSLMASSCGTTAVNVFFDAGSRLQRLEHIADRRIDVHRCSSQYSHRGQRAHRGSRRVVRLYDGD